MHIIKTDGLRTHGYEGSPLGSGDFTGTLVFNCVGLCGGGCGGIYQTVSSLHGGKAGTLEPHLLGEIIHGMRVGEVMKFDFHHIGTGGGWGTMALTMRPASIPSSWWRA